MPHLRDCVGHCQPQADQDWEGWRCVSHPTVQRDWKWISRDQADGHQPARVMSVLHWVRPSAGQVSSTCTCCLSWWSVYGLCAQRACLYVECVCWGLPYSIFNKKFLPQGLLPQTYCLTAGLICTCAPWLFSISLAVWTMQVATIGFMQALYCIARYQVSHPEPMLISASLACSCSVRIITRVIISDLVNQACSVSDVVPCLACAAFHKYCAPVPCYRVHHPGSLAIWTTSYWWSAGSSQLQACLSGIRLMDVSADQCIPHLLHVKVTCRDLLGISSCTRAPLSPSSMSSDVLLPAVWRVFHLSCCRS